MDDRRESRRLVPGEAALHGTGGIARKTGRPCSICFHPHRAEIDAALVDGQPFRHISIGFGVSHQALRRHYAAHLRAAIQRGRLLAEERAQRGDGALVKQAAAVAEGQDARALDLWKQLGLCFERSSRLFAACDRWLADPDRPGEYNLGPRAHEIEVVYLEAVGKHRAGTEVLAPRVATLADLLQRAQGGGVESVQVRTRYADPRKLVLEASKRLEEQIALLADLMGRLEQDNGKNLVSSPEWVDLRSRIVKALEPFEEARLAVAAALTAADANEN